MPVSVALGMGVPAPVIVKRRDPIAWSTSEGLSCRLSRWTVMVCVVLLMSNVAWRFPRSLPSICGPVANTTVFAWPAGANASSSTAHASRLTSPVNPEGSTDGNSNAIPVHFSLQ